MWTFVPSAGAILAEWGAEVVKVEHPVGGDPQRGLVSSGFLPSQAAGIDYMIEIPNRGKRSIGLDLAQPDGLKLLHRLVEQGDVFLTNFLPDARKRLRIDVDDIRAVNPAIIYARGSGAGPKGPEAGRGGFDSASYWARGGIGYALSPPDAPHPVRMRSAFGDVMGGLTIAGAIAAALFHRDRTGEPSIVDVSLLGLALWNLSVDVAQAKLFPDADVYRYDPDDLVNPIVGIYRTKDGRHINLTMLQSDRYWNDLCDHLGRPDLADDPRFKDHDARATNSRACTQELKAIFAGRTLAEWKEALATTEGVWAPLQTPAEVHEDRQVVANGYIARIPTGAGDIALVTGPAQFDETPAAPVAAPTHGQHTEEILLELGLTWDEILAHKESGAVL
jgi:crotonobetainyl-CoA:carnitine CoA-transferase CaiB-like acyl-CoA transferase